MIFKKITTNCLQSSLNEHAYVLYICYNNLLSISAKKGSKPCVLVLNLVPCWSMFPIFTLYISYPWPGGSVSWSVTQYSKGWRFGRWSGRVREATDQCFSLTSMFLSLPSSLSKINKHILGWELKIKIFKNTRIGNVGFLGSFVVFFKGTLHPNPSLK